jgi:hypothetical protein
LSKGNARENPRFLPSALPQHQTEGMTTTKTFLPSDLFEFNNVNFDPLTATYDVAYYLSYLARWYDWFLKMYFINFCRPDYNYVSKSIDGKMMGYSV